MISKRGRMFIIAAAFMIALSGPTKNLIKNGEILSDSLSCSQDQLRIALNEFSNAIKEPYKIMKETFSQILPVIKENVEKIKTNLIEMKRHLTGVVQNIRKAFAWLASIANMCNMEPYKKCIAGFEQSIGNCRDNLGIFASFCDAGYLVKNFCYTFKTIEVLCEIIDFISDSVLTNIEKQMKIFVDNVKEIFYVSVSIDHNFEFQTNSSKNLSQIQAEINKDIQERTSHALKFIDFAKIFLSLYFILIFIKAIQFHRKYLSHLHYKNIYITRQFYDIDKHRDEMGMDKVLPLTHKERKRYIEMTSIKLMRHEWRHIFSSSIFLLFSSMHLSGILIADYSLFWILTMIRFYYYGNQASIKSEDIESEVAMFSIEINGEGIIAEFCQDLANILKPLMNVDNLDFTKCLPMPLPPDFEKYKTIVLFTSFSWILLFCEPYALRLKHVIMHYYYPEMSKDRSIWLYNEILRKRTSFLKYIRRQAKNKIFGKDSLIKEEKTFIQLVRSKLNRFPILTKIIGQNESLSCVLCGREEKDDLIRCETSACTGIFCFECYNDVKKLCPMCNCFLENESENESSLAMVENFNSSDEEYITNEDNTF
ncbi:hypothetical protein PVAND_008184 [Polypedilum vanderplanki]|uniref:RING-type domain-containing protein n=1 Tax=Polypedilum vanderplanki TaxID=319348 RepID=A0A9J6C9C2_POLVA|nr:hypothetical protein PVAND_008184 [Polypedilum vanderplanki]